MRIGRAIATDVVRQRLHIGGPGDGLGRPVQVERMKSEGVAGEQKPLVALVPHRQNELAFDALQKPGVPAAIGRRDDRRVACLGRQRQDRREIVAIVESPLERDSQSALRERPGHGNIRRRTPSEGT